MSVLIGLIGKPGSGKTTVGQMLAEQLGFQYVSYGQLLKVVQSNPGVGGYSIADREKVNEYILELRTKYPGIVISFNPPPDIKFWLLEQIGSAFDHVALFYLQVSDATAHERLINRDREVLNHEGATQLDRLTYFSTKQLPIIREFQTILRIKELVVDNKSKEKVLASITAELASTLDNKV